MDDLCVFYCVHKERWEAVYVINPFIHSQDPKHAMLFSLMFQQYTAFKYNVLLKMLSIHFNGKLEIKYPNSLLFFLHRNCNISWFLELQINRLQSSFVGSDFFISELTYSVRVWVDTTEWFKKEWQRQKKRERYFLPTSALTYTQSMPSTRLLGVPSPHPFSQSTGSFALSKTLADYRFDVGRTNASTG